MGPARIAVLVIAAIAAIAAVLIMRSLMAGPREVAVETSAPVTAPTAEVLSAGRDIAPGERIQEQDLIWAEWPQTAVNPSLILRSAQPDAMEIYANAIARADINDGEPILPSRVVRADAANLMAAMLTPGMRAVSVPISEENAAGGFILAGDRVDVLLTRERNSDLGGGGYATDTILGNVRVLAIDQTVKSEEGAASMIGSTATLELSGHDAELLYEAQALGQLRLALRSVVDSVGERVERRAAGLRAVEAETTPVQVYRYGGVSQVAVQAASEGAR